MENLSQDRSDLGEITYKTYRETAQEVQATWLENKVWPLTLMYDLCIVVSDQHHKLTIK